MGRFDSTVEFYVRYREPYPAAFFAAVADRLSLSRRERLLDAGCGPAWLAIGFAPYVGALAGIDPEPRMLEAAAIATRKAGVPVRLLSGRLEDLPADAGSFELVTIGRALHWMDRAATLPVLDRHVSAGGAIAVCGCSAVQDATPWGLPFREVWRRWTDESMDCYKIDFEHWFDGSRFRRLEEVRVRSTQRLAIDDVIGRALSLSVTSPEKLGDRRAAFEAEIRATLEPFAKDGKLVEELEAVATLYR